jgi:hypothetical protein
LERRRKSQLTPMSGEVKAAAEWRPADPVKEAKPRRRRKERRAPATRGAAILHGLKRLALLLTAVAGAVVLVAWLVASHWNRSFSHVLPLAFYFAGAGVGAFAVLGGTGVGRSYRYTGGYGAGAGIRREVAVNTSFFFACLALFLFGAGIALDYLL